MLKNEILAFTNNSIFLFFVFKLPIKCVAHLEFFFLNSCAQCTHVTDYVGGGSRLTWGCFIVIDVSTSYLSWHHICVCRSGLSDLSNHLPASSEVNIYVVFTQPVIWFRYSFLKGVTGNVWWLNWICIIVEILGFIFALLIFRERKSPQFSREGDVPPPPPISRLWRN